MLRQHSTLRALLRNYWRPAILATAALLLVGNATWADDNKGNGSKGNEAGDDRAIRRDVHAANAHYMLNWDINGAVYGRVALGLPPDAPL